MNTVKKFKSYRLLWQRYRFPPKSTFPSSLDVRTLVCELGPGSANQHPISEPPLQSGVAGAVWPDKGRHSPAPSQDEQAEPQPDSGTLEGSYLCLAETTTSESDSEAECIS